MKQLQFLEQDGELKIINVETGMVERHYINGTIYSGSDQWKITSVSLINNFGYTVERLNLDQFFNRLKTDKTTLFYKNGLAKFRVNDLDHGTNRQWGKIYKIYHVSAIDEK